MSTSRQGFRREELSLELTLFLLEVKIKKQSKNDTSYDVLNKYQKLVIRVYRLLANVL